MIETPTVATPDADLRALLERASDGLTERIVASARASGREVAASTVSRILEDELARPPESFVDVPASGASVRAAHLAAELELGAAIPALVRCVELLPSFEPLQAAASGAIVRLGPDALDALLAAIPRSGTPGARGRMAGVLALAGAEAPRAVPTFVRMLPDDPTTAASCLADVGAWRTIPELVRTLERICAHPDGTCDCAIWAFEPLLAVTRAIRVLGGTVPAALQAHVDEVLGRVDARWTPGTDPEDAVRPA